MLTEDDIKMLDDVIYSILALERWITGSSELAKSTKDKAIKQLDEQTDWLDSLKERIK